MLEVKNLCVNYGNLVILKNVNLDIEQGEIVSLIGANGAGKTTLCKAISRLVDPVSGEILYHGESLNDKTPGGVVARKIIQVPEGRKLFCDMTVKENLLLGAHSKTARDFKKSSLEYVYELFPDLVKKEKQPVGSLSGGQQQMVAIGRGLMANPDVLILDEPSIGLSPLMTQNVLSVIKKINQNGVSVLIAEQNVNEVLKIADRAFVLEQGEIVLSGKASDMLNNEEVKKAYLGI